MQAVLVTGASAGIGREMARGFARRGNNLVLVARREGKLHQLATEVTEAHDVETEVIPMDLARPGAAEELFGEVNDGSIHIHTLVNNAGFGILGPFADNDAQREQALLQLNIVTLTELTQTFLGPMRDRGSGAIMNVASTGAFVPGPFVSTYYASKAYVLSFTEGIAEELRDENIRVTCLCPGATESGFMHEAGVDEAGLRTIIEWIFMGVAKPEDVAEYGIRSLEKGKVVAVHGLWNRILFGIMRRLPRFLPRTILARLQGASFRE